MSAVAGPGPAGPGGEALSPERAKLRAAAHQLEGVFLGQLFQAMRATVPTSESDAGGGQELFRSMLDDTLAAKAAERMQRGLGEALYRQLSRRLPDGGK